MQLKRNMMKNYTYPHVGIKTTVISRRAAQEQVEDKVSLFVPFQSDIGPTNTVLKFNSLSDFTATYGDLNYSKQGETACIIRNWLMNNYGTIYACRLFDSSKKKASYERELVLRSVVYDTADANYVEIPRADLLDKDGNLSIAGSIAGRLTYIAIPGIDGVIDFTASTLNGILTMDEAKAYGTHFYFLISKSSETDTTYNGDYNAENNTFAGYSNFAFTVINGGNDSATSEKLKLVAKYNGEMYNSLAISFSFYKNGYTRITTKLDGSLIDSRNVVNSSIGNFASSTEFLSDSETEIGSNFIAITKLKNIDILLADGEPDSDNLNAAVKKYFEGTKAFEHLSNRLETPVNLILDPGYAAETKEAVAKFIKETLIDGGKRDDFMFVVSRYSAAINANKKFIGRMDIAGDNSGELTFGDGSQGTVKEANFNSEFGNFVIYDQYFSVEEALAGTGADSISIQVTPSYFLSTLIPRNDHLYGIQYPVAGLTRGTITGVLSMNENFDPDTKQAKFDAEINYVEKDSRGYHFMSQRTHDSSKADDVISPLSFFNNVRVRNLITKEVEQLGREYLFEFNDATTLNNMSNVLNQYINNWVQNRTLQEGYVLVEADEYSSEKINVTIYMKFTGTIETISVNIILE